MTSSCLNFVLMWQKWISPSDVNTPNQSILSAWFDFLVKSSFEAMNNKSGTVTNCVNVHQKLEASTYVRDSPQCSALGHDHYRKWKHNCFLVKMKGTANRGCVLKPGQEKIIISLLHYQTIQRDKAAAEQIVRYPEVYKHMRTYKTVSRLSKFGFLKDRNK